MSAPPLALLIDPGHGGENSGAVVDAVTEKHWTLRLGLMLRDVAVRLGCAVQTTRQDDSTVALADRPRPNQDLALSIHFDKSPVQSIGALRTYVMADSGHAAWSVASAIANAAPSWCRARIPGVTYAKADDWTLRAHNVLRHHKCPAVLVECCYMSNPAHMLHLNSLVGQSQLIMAMQTGIDALRTHREQSYAPKD